MQNAYRSQHFSGTLAWYDNFLKRMVALCVKLHAVEGHRDTDLVQQILKAMSVSFGGAFPSDYPKVTPLEFSADLLA